MAADRPPTGSCSTQARYSYRHTARRALSSRPLAVVIVARPDEPAGPAGWVVCRAAMLTVSSSVTWPPSDTHTHTHTVVGYCCSQHSSGKTRKLCDRKDDRAMRPTYGWPEHFRDSPDYAHGHSSQHYHGLLFRSTLWMFLQNLKSVALPVPEIRDKLQTPNFGEGECHKGRLEPTNLNDTLQVRTY